MDQIAPAAFRFGEFTIDLLRRSLHQGGREIALRPKSFDVLACLVRNPGRTVAKEELIEAVWSDVTVTDESLTRCVSDVRAALGDGEQRLIKTIPRRGYLFATTVMPLTADSDMPAGLTEGGTASRELAAGASTRRDRSNLILIASLAVAACMLSVGGWVLWSNPQPSLKAASERPVLAVLPFVNLSESSRLDYLSDGVTGDITSSLARIGSLTVIAPASSFRYRGQSIDLKTIGRELGARYLLQGSVRQDPERLRIAAQLIDAESGAQLWGDHYEGEPSGVFSAQDDLVLKIANLLSLHVAKSELDRALRKRPENLDAYHLVLRANALMRRNSAAGRAEAISEARDLYARAAVGSPRYAPAFEGLANTYLAGWIEPLHANPIGREYRQQAIIDRAQSLAQTAIQLDETLAEARATLAWILYWRHGPAAGIAEFERALAFNPNLVDERFGLLLLHGGRAAEALDYMRRLMRLDPHHSPRASYFLGKAHFFLGRYPEAIALIAPAAAQMPGHRPSRALLAAVAAHLGRTEEARAAAAEVLRIDPQFTIAAWMKFMRISDEGYAERLANGLRLAGLPD